MVTWDQELQWRMIARVDQELDLLKAEARRYGVHPAEVARHHAVQVRANLSDPLLDHLDTTIEAAESVLKAARTSTLATLALAALLVLLAVVTSPWVLILPTILLIPLIIFRRGWVRTDFDLDMMRAARFIVPRQAEDMLARRLVE